MIWYISLGELSYVLYIGQVENPHPFHRAVNLQVKSSTGTLQDGFSRDTQTVFVKKKNGYNENALGKVWILSI